MAGVILHLDSKERAALKKFANKERRTMRHQAEYMVVRELRLRDYLPHKDDSCFCGGDAAATNNETIEGE